MSDTHDQAISELFGEQPYIERSITHTVRLYNAKYGDNRICQCGHTYIRHFDHFEELNDQDVGCKYCDCDTFREKR